MELILVRHGVTKESKKKILLGNLPGALTTQGRNFARITGRTLAALPHRPRIIIASDLKRSKDTARIIARILHIPLKFDILLRERRGGIAEGKTENQIKWKEYEKKSLARRRHKDGESFIDVKKRARSFLKKICKEKRVPIIIISHNTFLSMLLSVLFGWSYAKSLNFDFRNKLIIIDTKKAGVDEIPLLRSC